MATTLRAEVLRELFGNTLDDVDVSLKNSFDEMSLEKFDECLRNVEWDNFNVFQLRDFNTKVKNLIISTKIDKKKSLRCFGRSSFLEAGGNGTRKTN